MGPIGRIIIRRRSADAAAAKARPVPSEAGHGFDSRVGACPHRRTGVPPPIKSGDMLHRDVRRPGLGAFLLWIAVTGCAAVVLSLSDVSAQVKGTSARGPAPAVKTATATIVATFPPVYASQEGWCYDKEPSFIYARGQHIMRADLKGNISQIADTPEYYPRVLCSDDGRTIATFADPGTSAWGSTIRLTIIDTRTNELGEYQFHPPRRDPVFETGWYSLMSRDGRVFALPAPPELTRGQPLLSGRRVVHVDTSDLFWTKDMLFVRGADEHHYKVTRLSDWRDLGEIAFPKDRRIFGFAECQGGYLVQYEAHGESILESIADPRLGRSRARRFRHADRVEQTGDLCAVTSTYQKDWLPWVTSARIVGRDAERDIDLRPLDTWSASISKDGRFLLGKQVLGRVGDLKETRFMVFEVK